jgi:hypothetical protein
LLAEVLPLLGSQIMEPSGPVPNPFLFFGRKTPEVLITFADRLLLLGGEFLPPLESFFRLFPLLGRHALPSFRSPAEALLSFRGHLIPLLSKAPQDLLFFRSELFP